MKFCKLIDNTLEFAPRCTENVSNYNTESNLEMLLKDGWKPLIEAEREEGKIYNVTYEETEDEIKEILEDITEEIEKSKKIEEINKRIKELEDLFSNDILYNNGTSKEIYTEIINGLIETRNKIMFSLEEIDNEEIEEEN